MATAKSPFFIVREFLSPKTCEEIVSNLGFFSPDVDINGRPIKMVRSNALSEELIYTRFQPLIPTLEEYYGFTHRGTESVTFEYYAEGTSGQPICESCNYLRKKWVRTKDRDFTAVIFFSDFQDKDTFEEEYEVYGGKLEFPQHLFGFNPERGTLIIYPSGPHFINAVAPIQAGDLQMAKFHLAAQMPYLYDPKKFPGDYRTWFAGL